MVDKITYKETLPKNYLYIDVRTPKEHAQETIPKAINIPLFSNEERVIVGTLYHKKGQEIAIDEGMKLVSKKLPNLLKKFSKHKDKELIIFCWRGGMRSGSLAALLEQLGYKVKQLDGGYKQYRAYVREQLENYKLKPKLVVLYGLTGAGKTEIINKFKNNLDLEGLAQHRSSLLGSVGLNPRTQKMFESLLLERLEELKDEKYIIIEGESRKIGTAMMPEFLFAAMKKGIKLLIERDVKERARRLVKEYGPYKKELAEKIKLLEKYAGKKKVQEYQKMLAEGKDQELAEKLLIEYYDPRYGNSLKDIKYDQKISKDYVKEINSLLLP